MGFNILNCNPAIDHRLGTLAQDLETLLQKTSPDEAALGRIIQGCKDLAGKYPLRDFQDVFFGGLRDGFKLDQELFGALVHRIFPFQESGNDQKRTNHLRSLFGAAVFNYSAYLSQNEPELECLIAWHALRLSRYHIDSARAENDRPPNGCTREEIGAELAGAVALHRALRHRALELFERQCVADEAISYIKPDTILGLNLRRYGKFDLTDNKTLSAEEWRYSAGRIYSALEKLAGIRPGEAAKLFMNLAPLVRVIPTLYQRCVRSVHRLGKSLTMVDPLTAQTVLGDLINDFNVPAIDDYTAATRRAIETDPFKAGIRLAHDMEPYTGERKDIFPLYNPAFIEAIMMLFSEALSSCKKHDYDKFNELAGRGLGNCQSTSIGAPEELKKHADHFLAQARPFMKRLMEMVKDYFKRKISADRNRFLSTFVDQLISAEGCYPKFFVVAAFEAVLDMPRTRYSPVYPRFLDQAQREMKKIVAEHAAYERRDKPPQDRVRDDFLSDLLARVQLRINNEYNSRQSPLGLGRPFQHIENRAEIN